MSNGAKWPKYTKWKFFEKLEYITLKKRKIHAARKKDAGEKLEC
jgi:hypothetical protein